MGKGQTRKLAAPTSNFYFHGKKQVNMAITAIQRSTQLKLAKTRKVTSKKAKLVAAKVKRRTSRKGSKKSRKEKKSKKSKARKGSKRGSHLLKPMTVDDTLAAVIGKKKASRAQIIKGLWTYIKKHKLQDPNSGRLFTPDQKMAKLFGHKKMNGFSMAKYLNKHMR